jgi:hypothetical protein
MTDVAQAIVVVISAAVATLFLRVSGMFREAYPFMKKIENLKDWKILKLSDER